MKIKNLRALAFTIVTLTLCVAAISVHAGHTIAYCDRADAGVFKLDMTDAFTHCESGTGNDSASAVNTQMFFDMEGDAPGEDWMLLSRQGTPGALEEPVDIDLAVTCTDNAWMETGCATTQGTWLFNQTVWDTYDDVMIVMKGSHDFSGYLLENLVSMGKWSTDGDPLLSHLTVYARRGDSGGMIPEPTSLSLLVMGFIGARHFRKKGKPV